MIESFDRRFARAADLIDLTRNLIRIPSEDPPGDTRPIAAFLQQYLAKSGVQSEIVAPDPKRPSVVASIRFPGAGRRVVFNGHIETLPAGDRSHWRRGAFDGAMVDGRLYGRGARCMKGGIAALVSAALLLQDRDDLAGEIVLALVSDEVNGGGRGTGYLLEHRPEMLADAALVGEGGPWINVAHKGAMFIKATAEGISGHGALGFATPSATHRLMDFLMDLRRLEQVRVPTPPALAEVVALGRATLDADYGSGATEALGRLTVNVGTIGGGTKVNMVAERAAAHVDLRIPLGMALVEARGFVEEVVARHEGLTIRELWANEPTTSNTDHPWLRLLRDTSASVYGSPRPFIATPGFTDARFFRLKGIPVAGSAPVGAGVGAPDEYVDISSLVQLAAFFERATAAFLAGQTS